MLREPPPGPQASQGPSFQSALEAVPASQYGKTGVLFLRFENSNVRVIRVQRGLESQKLTKEEIENASMTWRDLRS
jgi:hypothetical protein